MTDFEKIKREALSKNWTCEPGTGDHFKFRPPDNPKCFVAVSMSVNATARAYKNSLKEFRRFDKDFLRPEHVKKKSDTTTPEPSESDTPIITTQQTNSSNDMKPQDKTIHKQYAWLQIGTKVRLKDKPEQETPGVVSEIHSSDKKRVWDTTDIIVFNVKDKKFECMAGELDAWETRKCQECGRTLPLNWFKTSSKTLKKQYTCCECLNKTKDAEANKERTLDTILTEMETNYRKDDNTFNLLVSELTLMLNNDKIQSEITPEQMKKILWFLLEEKEKRNLICTFIKEDPNYAVKQMDMITMMKHVIQTATSDKKYISFFREFRSKMSEAANMPSILSPIEQHRLMSEVSDDVLLDAVRLRHLEQPREPLSDQKLLYELETRGLNKPNIKKLTDDQLTDEIIARKLSFPRIVSLMTNDDLLNEMKKRNIKNHTGTDDMTDKQLYDALKARGWNIGKLERTVIQTLE